MDMEKKGYAIVTKVEGGGYLVIPPPIEDRELRLFATFDGVLDYMFDRLDPKQSQNMCKYISQRLQHYCREAEEEIQKGIREHLQDKHRYNGDALSEQSY